MLPGERTFKVKLFPQQCAKLRGRINDLVKDATIAINIDMWTSKTQPVFFTVLLSCLTPDFHLTNVCLSTQEFAGSHTSIAIAKEMKAALAFYSIDQARVCGIVTDNGANVNFFAKDAFGGKAYSCVCNTLQLSITLIRETSPALECLASA